MLRFAIGLQVFTAALGLAAPLDFSPPEFPLSVEQQAMLDTVLETYGSRYDPECHLIRCKVGGYNYHSNLRNTDAHQIRGSAEYAVALLDSGSEANRERALLVLDAVIKLQHTDPASRVRGIWPYYLEEPVPEMGAADRNWADFIGVQLLQARIDHAERIPAGLRSRLDDAIRLAAEAIRKRNVGPGYTNISIMGAFVSLATAQLYSDADLGAYAKKRWSYFYDYTISLGGFNEYNSPTYTIVALDELVRILQYVEDSDARKQAAEIHDLAWKGIAIHHHPPSGQWCGPHSRSYRTLLSSSTGALLDQMAGRPVRGHGKNLESHRLQHECPEAYRNYFREISEPRLVTETFVGGDNPVVGTTWITPGFSLGSANRADLWNQRRPLVAYWGSRRSPSYLQLRFLRDGYDFAATQIFVRQDKHRALAALNFATNGGNKHVSIDRLKDGKVRTSDFRLRFELGGGAREAEIELPAKTGDTVTLRHAGRTITLTVPVARVGEMSGSWEAGADGKNAWLDLVFHHGDPVVIDLMELEEAVIAIALSIDGDDAPAKARAARQGKVLKCVWNGLAVTVPVKPDTVKNLQAATR